MNLGLQNKVALVAAASRGLGKATAMALAMEGANVAIVARNAETLNSTADEIRKASGSKVLAVTADLSQATAIEQMVITVEQELGLIDILVNNAGGPRAGRFTDVSDEDYIRAVELNLMSTIRMSRLVLPNMRTRGWGRIINITSISVKQPLPNLILSNTARAGVVAMAKTLAGQVAAEGITVNNICPGYVLTDRVKSLAQTNAAELGKEPKEIIAQWESSIPARRLGKPEELGALITYLASEQAAYITGATIQMDGGLCQGLF